MTDKHNPSPRIYLAKRHRAWWYTIPRWERSKIVNAALDLWREKTIALPDSVTDPRSEEGDPASGRTKP